MSEQEPTVAELVIARVVDVGKARKAGFHYVSHDYGQLCLVCAADYPLTGEIALHASGGCYNCAREDDLESRLTEARGQ